MKKTKKIRNTNTLEREIYRLQLEAKNLEEKIDRNLEHLQENYFSMTMNSFFQKKEKKSFFESVFRNENFTATLNKVTDHISSRAAESIETLVDKIFHKKEKS